MVEKGTVTGSGHVLRIRTPDHRWIEVPYGGGQDTNLRSVNIWDGVQWLCPTWGRLLWVDMFTDPGLLAEFSSLLYRSDRLVWVGAKNQTSPDRHEYNPTYRHHEAGSQQFTFSYEPKWVRLFYLTPRSVETYRIVPLNYPFPRQPPNRTLDYDWPSDARFSFQTMWPAFSRKAYLSEDGLPVTSLGGPTSDWPTATQSPGNTLYQPGPNLPMLCASVYVHSVGPAKDWDGTRWSTDYRGSLAGMIDLKAIRQRISKVYDGQDVNYTGQKHPISGQELQWVIVKGQINVSLLYWVAEGQEKAGGIDFDGVVFSLKSDHGIDTVTDPQVLEPIAGLYRADCHYPVSTDPQGTALWSATAQQLTHTLNVQHRDVGIRPGLARYWNQYSLTGTYPLERSFQYPGEENIGFFTEILNPVLWTQDYSELTIRLAVTYQQITLGYRDFLTTFPEDLIRWDALP